ncbi:MAG TPA: DUF2255 family protein [Acidimicrobiia bacterium]|nr:DUF2255 family protein [Acidimicrobiia bacterium]
MTLTNEQLALIDRTREVRVETFSTSGSVKTVIWIVVVDGTVYVRSVRGDDGHWYQRALANPLLAIHVGDERIEFRAIHVSDPDEIVAVSNALREKYPAGGSLDRMTRAGVLDNTLRLEPMEPSDEEE